MNGRLISGALNVVLTALIFGLCLFGSSTALWASSIGTIFREISAVFRDSGTQWMVFLCLCVYFAVFNLLQNRQKDNRFWRLNNLNIWLAVTLLIASLFYALNYSNASKSAQPLTLLAGAVLGKGAGVWALWRTEPLRLKRSILTTVILLIGMLTLASLWHSEAIRTFQYRSHARWSGPWDNPNIYGLLMGAGVTLALGLGVGRWKMEDGKTERGDKSWKLGVRNYAAVILCFVAAMLMTFGLLHSYSRGAWLATGCGLFYLAVTSFRFSRLRQATARQAGVGNDVSRFAGWFRRNRLSVAVVALSVVIIAFWQFRHTEQPVVRRAFSVGNVGDFSWRNRVAAGEGTLQMMAERPLFGFGWNQVDPMYNQYYRSSKVPEAGAIEMNDYLMLGATLGLPALFCFAAYIWLSLRQDLVGAEVTRLKLKENQRLLTSSPTILKTPQNPTLVQMNWLQTACRAGAIVLLVGFWFDGGLFKLPTAATFWILLELGRRDLTTDGPSAAQPQPKIHKETRKPGFIF